MILCLGLTLVGGKLISGLPGVATGSDSTNGNVIAEWYISVNTNTTMGVFIALQFVSVRLKDNNGYDYEINELEH